MEDSEQSSMMGALSNAPEEQYAMWYRLTVGIAIIHTIEKEQ